MKLLDACLLLLKLLLLLHDHLQEQLVLLPQGLVVAKLLRGPQTLRTQSNAFTLRIRPEGLRLGLRLVARQGPLPRERRLEVARGRGR